MQPTNNQKTKIAAAVGVVLSGFGFSHSAVAACTVDGDTYTVNTNLDAISMTPSVVTLRQAILDANVDPATCDLINFAESMNGQTINLDLVANSGELDINGHVNIVGPGSDQLTIKTSGAGSHQRAMNFEAGDISVSGITFDGEGTSSSAGLYGYPFSDANIELDDIVVENVTDQEGLYLYGGAAATTLMVTNSRFESNAGSGIYVENLDTVVVTDSEFNMNAGSGLSIEADIATVENLSADGNARGLYISMSTMGTVTVSDSSITNNTMDGGIYLATGIDGDATIENVTVDGNTNDNSGGGIRIGRGGEIVIRNSTISNNTATNFGSGGGISLDTSSAEMQVIIENSTISGNSAAGRGGGIAMQEYIDPSSQAQIIRFSTITDNSADEGGGVYANSFAFDIDISNTIIAGNTATTSDDEILIRDNLPTNTITLSYNFIGSSDGMGFTNDNSILNGGDPMLAALGMPALSNSETEVHEPEIGSPVIDIGDPALTAGTGDTPNLDQNGRSRVVNTRIDIGSVEYNSNVAPVLDMAIAETMIEVGTALSLDLDDFFSDVNGDLLTYSILNLVDLPDAIGITGSMATGTFVEGDIGTYTVEYQACDDEMLCATGDGSLVIEEMNVAPVLDTAITEGSVEIGEAYSLDLDNFFSDANGDAITYSILNADDLPDSIELAGSMVTGSFDEDDVGTYTVDYQACDDEPLCTTGSGTLIIEEMPEESEEEGSSSGGGVFGLGSLLFLVGLLPVWMRRKF